MNSTEPCEPGDSFWCVTGIRNGSSIGNASRLTNVTFEERFDKEALYRIVVPIMLVMCLISILENCWILLAACFVKRSMSPTLCFNVSLAGADAYASLVISVGLVLNNVIPMLTGINVDEQLECLVLTTEGFRVGGMISSVLHLLGLAINHYIGIANPLHYQSIVTRRVTLWTIALTWILPLAFNMIYFSLVKDEGYQRPTCDSFIFLLSRTYRIIIASMFFLPLVAMVIIYVHILVIIRHHRKGVLESTQTEQTRQQMKSNIKAVVTTLLILGTYVIGWMPAVIVFITICLDCMINFTEVNPLVLTVTNVTSNCLIIIKSLVDPIVYAARIHEVQDALRRMHFQLCHLGTPPAPQAYTTQSTCTTGLRSASPRPQNGSRGQIPG